MKYKVKTIPCSMYDTEAFENWLGDMAKSGWFIIGIWSVYACFKKGEPAEVKYRLEPKEDREQERPSGSAEEMYLSFGWQYVCRYSNYGFVWKGEKHASEIHTDPVLQSEIYKKVVRSAWRQLIFMLVLTAVAIPFVIWVVCADGTPVKELVENTRSGALIFIVIMLPLAVFDSVYDLILAKKLKKQLENGESLTHKKKYSKRNFYRSLMAAAAAAGIVCVYFLPFYALFRQGTTLTSQLEQPDFQLLRLEDMEGGGFKYKARFQYNGQDYSNMSLRKWSPLAPTWYEISENGVIEGTFWQYYGENRTYEPQLKIAYYDLLFPFMADRLMDDLYISSFSRAPGTAENAVCYDFETDGIDEGYAVKLNEPYMWRAFARKDGKVVSIEYRGFESLYEQGGLIAKMLE